MSVDTEFGSKLSQLAAQVEKPAAQRTWDGAPIHLASPSRPWLTCASLLCTDMLGFFGAGCAGVLLGHLLNPDVNVLAHLRFTPALILLMLAFGLMGLYPGILLNPVEELRRSVYAISVTYLVIIAGTFLLKESMDYSRGAFVLAWLLSMVFVIALRALLRRTVSEKSWWGVAAIVLGAGDTGRQIVRILRKHRSLGVKVVAMLDDDPAQCSRAVVSGLPPVLGGLDLAPALVQRYGISYAIVAMPGVPTKRLSAMLTRHAADFRHLLIIPDLFGICSLGVSAKDFGGILGLEVRQRLSHRLPRLAKRMSDLLLAGAGILFLLPLFAVIYLSIRLTSPGPVFYGTRRLGRDCRPIMAWKFRSMVQNADAVLSEWLEKNPKIRLEWEKNEKLRHDPRITPVGRILRRTSLDELPQLWNVFRGDMSLVGPRPILEDEVPKYGDTLDLYLKVCPGLTGLWQVSGRNNTTYEERLQYVEYYVRNWSIWLDIYILGRTLKAVLFAEGAY